MIDFKTIRESLTPTQVVDILSEFGVSVISENDNIIIFPTVCHNLEYGSSKLYYYKNTHLFHCYTQCGGPFDIIELIYKIYKMRGVDKTLFSIARDLGFKETETEEKEIDVDYIRFIQRAEQYESYVTEFNRKYNTIPNSVLQHYSSNKEYLKVWTEEGISEQALNRYNIKYDLSNLAIVIPHKNKDGELIGIRGRFMAEEAKAKYMPLIYCSETMSHALGGNLYGLYENLETIKKYKTVILFEGEKSVLKMDTLYHDSGRNFSVAVCGSNVTTEQIEILSKCGVENVVLAFDKDYKTGEWAIVKKRYDSIAKKLSKYFTTSVILDYSDILGFKDSPIDCGKDAFEELFKYRYLV